MLMSRRCRFFLALVVCSSLVFTGIVAVFVTGLNGTSYDTTDSMGRSMGFNDPLFREHYWICFSNFQFERLMNLAYGYTWVLLCCHGIALGLISSESPRLLSTLRLFITIQPFLFPVGLISFAVLPFTFGDILSESLDREGVIDIPFIAIHAQPIWLLTVLVLYTALRFEHGDGDSSPT